MSEIIRRVESLSLEQQRQVLAYFQALEHALLRAESGKALLFPYQLLDHTSAAEMNEAIESAKQSILVNGRYLLYTNISIALLNLRPKPREDSHLKAEIGICGYKTSQVARC